MKTLKYLEVKKSNIAWRNELELVLTKWIAVQRAFVAQTDEGDLPYWYNERANVGFLAAAAWKARFAALEEFTVRKGPTGKNGKTGRGDLRLELDSATAFVEAKITWPSLGNLKSNFDVFWSRTEERVNQAREAAREPEKWSHTDSKRLGIVFAVPWIPAKSVENGDTAAIRKAFWESLDPFKKNSKVDFWAAYFPGQANHQELTKYTNGRVFPGVVLLGSTKGFK